MVDKWKCGGRSEFLKLQNSEFFLDIPLNSLKRAAALVKPVSLTPEKIQKILLGQAYHRGFWDIELWKKNTLPTMTFCTWVLLSLLIVLGLLMHPGCLGWLPGVFLPGWEHHVTSLPLYPCLAAPRSKLGELLPKNQTQPHRKMQSWAVNEKVNQRT